MKPITQDSRLESKKLACVQKLEEESSRIFSTVEQTAAELKDYYPQLIADGRSKLLDTEVQEKIDSLKRTTKTLKTAYKRSYKLSDELNARWRDLKKANKKVKFIPGPPANADIDLKEYSTNHFARGLSIYKLLLISFIGSFVGVVVETIWCLLKNGYIESRASLVYGPFNLVYGLGAVALTLALYKFRNRGSWLSFLGGMVVGSAIEYACSWGQELIFGTRSWDYSNMPFNLNGRVCLLYSVFWGFLGVLWIKDLYPRLSRLILKIPNRIGKITTWVLLAFFVFNAVVSCLAMVRWMARTENIAPSSPFWEMIDQHFPDERMEKVYTNMEFVK